MGAFFVRKKHTTTIQAGLLTLESSYLPHLPVTKLTVVFIAVFVLDYSGGPVPVLHRSSLLSIQHLNLSLFI